MTVCSKCERFTWEVLTFVSTRTFFARKPYSEKTTRKGSTRRPKYSTKVRVSASSGRISTITSSEALARNEGGIHAATHDRQSETHCRQPAETRERAMLKPSRKDAEAATHLGKEKPAIPSSARNPRVESISISYPLLTANQLYTVDRNGRTMYLALSIASAASLPSTTAQKHLAPVMGVPSDAVQQVTLGQIAQCTRVNPFNSMSSYHGRNWLNA